MAWVETRGWIGVRTGTSNTTIVVTEEVKGVPLTTKGIGVEGILVYFVLDSVLIVV
jgi:hypothetical protein